MLMNPEKIIEDARKSISRFCINECKSYCCRKGYLILRERNLELVTQNKSKELIKKKIVIKLKNNKYSLNMDIDGCPSLKEYKCAIHKNQDRPEACKQFPIFIKGNTIRLSPRCLAVKCGLFYPYISILLKNGFILQEKEFYHDLEIYKLLPETKKQVL